MRIQPIRGDSVKVSSVDTKDRDLLNLPVRLGGCGITSYLYTATFAREAMERSSVAVLRARASGTNERDAVKDLVKQATPIKEMHSKLQQSLVQGLNTDETKIFYDNSSYLGSRWLSTIPFGPHLKLSNHHISAGLHIRTLRSGSHTTCKWCPFPNETGHDDTCNSRANWRLARHEVLKKILAEAISADRASNVQVEPGIQGSRRRTDSLVEGPAATHGLATFYDLSIRAPTSTKPFKAVTRPTHNNTMLPLQVAGSLFKDRLDDIGEHKVTLYFKQVEPVPFEPLIIWMGGTLSRRTQHSFDHWGATTPCFKRAMEQMSVFLLRSRTQYFELAAPITLYFQHFKYSALPFPTFHFPFPNTANFHLLLPTASCNAR